MLSMIGLHASMPINLRISEGNLMFTHTGQMIAKAIFKIRMMDAP
jgi:hypothetical protein